MSRGPAIVARWWNLRNNVSLRRRCVKKRSDLDTLVGAGAAVNEMARANAPAAGPGGRATHACRCRGEAHDSARGARPIRKPGASVLIASAQITSTEITSSQIVSTQVAITQVASTQVASTQIASVLIASATTSSNESSRRYAAAGDARASVARNVHGSHAAGSAATSAE